jgi:hypothetical protein
LLETDEDARESLAFAVECVEAGGAVDSELMLDGLDAPGLPEIAGEFGDKFVLAEVDGAPLGAEAFVELSEGFRRLAGHDGGGRTVRGGARDPGGWGAMLGGGEE